MKKIVVLLLCAALCLCVCACVGAFEPIPEGVVVAAFDADTLIQGLCTAVRAGDAYYIANYVPSDTLEADVGAALDAALQGRMDCALRVDSVVWNAVEHARYIYCKFDILYASDAPARPVPLDAAQLMSPALLHDTLWSKALTYAFCVPTDAMGEAELRAALDGIPERCDQAYFGYLVETCRWSLSSFEDFYYIVLDFVYRADTLPAEDIPVINDPYEAVLYMMDNFRDGAETITLYTRDIPKEQLQLLLSIAQINDGADVVEEAAEGAGSYWEGEGCVAAMHMRYTGTAAQREECRMALKSVGKEIETELRAQDLTQEQTYRAISKAIAERVKYSVTISDASVAEALTPEMRFARTAYGALVGGESVCTGYASAFKTLCDRMGLPCWVLMGDYDGTGHAWNVVSLNGELRYVDLTFYDTAGGDKYLLFTQEEYQSRPYALEAGYALPDWCGEA